MNNPPYMAQGMMPQATFIPNQEELAKLMNQQKQGGGANFNGAHIPPHYLPEQVPSLA